MDPVPVQHRAPCSIVVHSVFGRLVPRGLGYVQSKSPLATENLLENTDGGRGGSEHHISVFSGRQLATSIYADGCSPDRYLYIGTIEKVTGLTVLVRSLEIFVIGWVFFCAVFGGMHDYRRRKQELEERSQIIGGRGVKRAQSSAGMLTRARSRSSTMRTDSGL